MASTFTFSSISVMIMIAECMRESELMYCYRVTIKIRFDFELNLLNNPQLHISAIVSVLGNVGKLC